MSYNTKNYVEQGGDRLVIGGDMVFTEEAGITGFPSDASFYVLDVDDIDISDIMHTPIDVTDRVPLETFQRLSAGERPVLFKNAHLNDYTYSIVSCCAAEGISVVGLGAMVTFTGLIQTITTVILYKDEERIMLKACSNEHIAALFMQALD